MFNNIKNCLDEQTTPNTVSNVQKQFDGNTERQQERNRDEKRQSQREGERMYSFLQLQIMESLPDYRKIRGLPWLVMTISFYSYLGALRQPAPITHGNNTSLAYETSVCTRSMRAGHCLASSLEETYKAVLGSSHLTDVETVEGNLPRSQYYPRAGPGPSPGHLSLEPCPNPLALLTCSVSNTVCSPKSFSLSP